MIEKNYIIDNPTLMSEWDFEKNAQFGFYPQSLTLGSGKKVWWKCKKGHEWQAIIANKNKGRNCPYCSGRKILKGYNDLATLNPSVAKEWNFENNGNLKPEQVSVSSNKKVWWKCDNGHEWESTIYHRNQGNGCPYCSNKAILQGYNDLTTLNPTLAKEWNFEKNGKLKPEQFTAGSGKKVWWICNKGHEWQATIKDRNQGNGCPYCSKRKKIDSHK